MSATAAGNTKNINRNKNKNKNKMSIRKAGAAIKNFLLAIFAIAVVLLIFLFLTNKYFFKIKNINISESSKYSYDEINGILKSNGIDVGAELYGVDIKKAKADINKNLTYIESVNITRVPPSTINVDIKTEEGFFGIMLGGDYYIISRNFRVVDKVKIVETSMIDLKPVVPPEIVTVETNAVKKCYLGETIEFSDEDIYDFLKEILGFFSYDETDENRRVMQIMISDIDITNKFKVVMNYSDKFLVSFGIFENISSKILNSFEIIAQLPDYAEGVINMDEGKTASFKYDADVSKLYKSVKNKNN